MTAITARDVERIRHATFLQSAEHHGLIGSTNDRALELALRGLPSLPLLIVADRQTAGRGRRSNRWWSRSGALTFSVVVDAPALGLETGRWPQISLATGLAVRAALADLLPAAEFRVKWPNDVYLNGAKVCGILVEVPPGPPGVLVIGIGINVNNSFCEAPEDLQRTATSLVDVARTRLPLADVLIDVLARLESQLERLAAAEDQLAVQWEPHCLLRGRTVHLDLGPRRLVGVCRGIDAEGGLLLDTETGTQRAMGGVVCRID